jgi:hypothetical protein
MAAQVILCRVSRHAEIPLASDHHLQLRYQQDITEWYDQLATFESSNRNGVTAWEQIIIGFCFMAENNSERQNVISYKLFLMLEKLSFYTFLIHLTLRQKQINDFSHYIKVLVMGCTHFTMVTLQYSEISGNNQLYSLIKQSVIMFSQGDREIYKPLSVHTWVMWNVHNNLFCCIIIAK